MGSSRGAHSPATPTETSALASDLAAQPDAHNIALPITDATPVSRSSAARAFGFEQVYPDLKDTNATAETKIEYVISLFLSFITQLTKVVLSLCMAWMQSHQRLGRRGRMSKTRIPEAFSG